ncbi:GNAT family N-acetyltransferase [Novosphingobium beihaiensis]|uniref:GNAT family N-acetyltransferase n=1 Tax=Novosphingobium beihaiensis TaxID=2930389 RepID=A0ABT0BSA4_9SPHN|nr:GNAT family N-acetyltransferase [Novosphingobium beihaiensis]MCJ2187924.1 GNAT family N-acetyltransferase [Novosphingobium beihaiensis]
MIAIRTAAFPADSDAVLDIWREYVASPSVSLDYQGYEDEFRNLPGKYAAPEGCILLAEKGARIAGTIALRKAGPAICEMKRLYVRPEARGTGLGRTLAEALIGAARRAGYAEMRLDVLAEFTAAQKLYTSLGFIPAEAVSFNPTPGTQFLGLSLT